MEFWIYIIKNALTLFLKLLIVKAKEKKGEAYC
jgi:hypothetical protein